MKILDTIRDGVLVLLLLSAYLVVLGIVAAVSLALFFHPVGILFVLAGVVVLYVLGLLGNRAIAKFDI